eukprot:868600_1
MSESNPVRVNLEEIHPNRPNCCCCCYQWECCKKYFPEWYINPDKIWKFFKIRLVIMIVIAILSGAGVILIDQYVFETGSTITWETMIVLFGFLTVIAWILVIYVKWQHKMYKWWVKICIVLLYAIIAIYLVIIDLVGQKGTVGETDSKCVDVWTIVHFLAGPFFAVLLPFWWTFITVTVWEGIEMYTTGLGDEEIACNRVMDIVVAVIGWWLIVLIFTYKFIPWISSKNAYDEWKSTKQRSDDGYETEMVAASASEATDIDNPQIYI